MRGGDHHEKARLLACSEGFLELLDQGLLTLGHLDIEAHAWIRGRVWARVRARVWARVRARARARVRERVRGRAWARVRARAWGRVDIEAHAVEARVLDLVQAAREEGLQLLHGEHAALARAADVEELHALVMVRVRVRVRVKG